MFPFPTAKPHNPLEKHALITKPLHSIYLDLEEFRSWIEVVVIYSQMSKYFSPESTTDIPSSFPIHFPISFPFPIPIPIPDPLPNTAKSQPNRLPLLPFPD